MHRVFVEKEIPKLEAALAARNEVHVTTECALLESSVTEMPPALAQRIESGCYVEAPRLILELAIAKVVEANRKHPDMVDLNCMELFVEGALRTLAKHPPADPALQKLADDYAKMCPAEAAKARLPASP